MRKSNSWFWFLYLGKICLYLEGQSPGAQSPEIWCSYLTVEEDQFCCRLFNLPRYKCKHGPSGKLGRCLLSAGVKLDLPLVKSVTVTSSTPLRLISTSANPCWTHTWHWAHFSQHCQLLKQVSTLVSQSPPWDQLRFLQSSSDEHPRQHLDSPMSGSHEISWPIHLSRGIRWAQRTQPQWINLFYTRQKS